MPRPPASRRTTSLHVAVVVVVPGCLALTWWQVERALSGNTLSWVYSVEWPFFAGYAVYMWWRLTHEAAPGEPAEPALTRRAAASEAPPPQDLGPGPEQGRSPVDDAREDERDLQAERAMEEYNRYLAALHASGRRKRW